MMKQAILALSIVLVSSTAHAMPKSFAPLIEKYQNTVVNISTKTAPKPVEAKSLPEIPPELKGTPFEHFFGGMPGMQPKQRRPQSSLGSGVIVEKDGLIFTNYHVVKGADDILVKVDGYSREFKAELIGSDPKNDIALLKVDTQGEDLPVAPLGNSDAMRVGDWVLAIGNPFGLASSVTAGIVSATGRNINQGPYDDFIQTDAAINPGNSGGPLFNSEGEVIGINTAILSRTGGYQGIGFAVPINTVKLISEQIKEHGRPIRGWLGVQIQTVTTDLADALGLDNPKGALIAEVVEGSPAEKGGLQSGDVILNFDGVSVEKMNDLPKQVAETAIGKNVKVLVRRGEKDVMLNITIEELDEQDAQEEKTEKASSDGLLGMTLKPLNSKLREQLSLEKDQRGVAVLEVERGSMAAQSGIRRGDVLVKVAGDDVNAVADVKKALDDADTTALVLVRRGGNNLFLALKVKEEEE
ncbi:MAG: DegQ family serine endoprotease [Pseudomonadota bacterium]|nr:DegQ family serine endoprotease [Pseudomonadota bacterium]